MMNNLQENTGKRIEVFDLIRAIACIGVILFHYTSRYLELYYSNSSFYIRFDYGYSMVIVFLMMSGFFMYSIRPLKATSFLAKKIVRLFPAYAVGIILIFIVTRFFLVDRSVSFVDLLINFTMLNNMIGVPYVDSAHWFVTVELVFILILFAIYLLRIKKVWIPLLIIDVLALILIILNKYVDIWIINVFYILCSARYIGVLIFGYNIAEIYNNNLKANKINIISLIISSAAQLIIADISNIIAFVVFGSFMLIVIANKKLLTYQFPKAFSPLFFISEISYPLYIIHQNLGYAMITNLDKYLSGGEFIILIPITVCILLAYIIHRFIETPCIKKTKFGG